MAARPSSTDPYVLALVPDLLLASRIQQALGPLGYQVECVAEGEALRARATARRPAAVLIDLAARGTAALDALRALKGQDAGAALPVVAFGPHRDAALLEAGRRAGADAVLVNAQLARDLPRVLRRVLGDGPEAAEPRGV